MKRQSGCSSFSDARSRLETDGERLKLRCEGSGVRRPLLVASSRDAVPGAFRFRGLASRVSRVDLRAMIDPGAGRSSRYACTKCCARESSSRSCHEQTALGGTNGSFPVRQRTKN